MNHNEVLELFMIPVDKIHILNPRTRPKKKSQQMTDNIDKLGLKRPIKVSPRKGDSGEYELVCGQGRLEACIALGQTEIPAFVVNLSKEERLLMSLGENTARKQYSATELIREIVHLEERGYSPAAIAKKTALGENYVSGILRLFAKGEERLIQAVERGGVPLNTAIMIANANDKDLQKILQDAYEEKKIKGRALQRVRDLIEKRSLYGKRQYAGKAKKRDVPKTTEGLVNAYRKEVMRQQLFIKKANLCERRLLYIISSLKTFFEDENFVNLLRAEGMGSVPKYIVERIQDAKARA